jgi:hypothetical protein
LSTKENLDSFSVTFSVHFIEEEQKIEIEIDLSEIGFEISVSILTF